MTAHAVEGGELEKSVEADVGALHGHYGGEGEHLSVAVPPLISSSSASSHCLPPHSHSRVAATRKIGVVMNVII